MNIRRLFLLSIILGIGLTACDRPAPEAESGELVQAENNAETPAEVQTEAQADAPLTILVTGATGTQGGAVARELLKRGYHVRGLTRDTESEKAQALTRLGVTMVEGDYGYPPSLTAAMKGVYGVFAVTLFWHGGYDAEVEHGKRLIDEAIKAQVSHFVLTSVAAADAGSGIPHFESKWEVEQYLHTTDLNWTIIRPVEFMDNWGWQLENYSQGRLVDPRQPDSSHQWIASRDIGFFVAEAFDHPAEWTGITKEIAGDQLTLAQLQAVQSEVFGLEIRYVQPSWEDFEADIGEEITQMYRWFENEGYSVDIEALRAQYPDLQTASEFLTEMAAEQHQLKGAD
jgi:uncharacterized protein YbjT (DUF2867 family)